MRITVQVVIENDRQNEPELHEVARLDRGELDAGTVGLQLEEAKQLLSSVQKVMVAEQVRSCLDARVPCPDCGHARRHKDARTITLRTAFGRLRLQSPRWRLRHPRALLLRDTTPAAAKLKRNIGHGRLTTANPQRISRSSSLYTSRTRWF